MIRYDPAGPQAPGRIICVIVMAIANTKMLQHLRKLFGTALVSTASVWRARETPLEDIPTQEYRAACYFRAADLRRA